MDTIGLRPSTIKTYHKEPYPAISALRPELSQAGKTVLIAGGSSGIGFAIARAFVQAKASRLILLGRRESHLKSAASTLATYSTDNSTTILPMVCDITSLSDTARLFDSLKSDNIFVDVLVLNAATTGEIKTLLDAGVNSVWNAFEFNVRTLMDLTEHFYKQEGKRQKYLVNVSSSAIHNFTIDAVVMPAYGLTKNAGTLLVQQIAKDVSPDDMQIVSFHPGGVLTELAKANGVQEELYDWDDENLPGQFAVWLASPEAKFAHGRMLAAHWDVDELKGEVKEKMEGQWNYLKIGLVGI
jgi:NAD(P)-dependent dehydrogenase (short-subunit alcohol dehydrogenase family)